MFFIIPFGIFIISIVAITWVVSRKFVYLKKLTPEVVESAVPEQESFWAELFPKWAAYFNSTRLRQGRLNFLAEFEKFLRKFRLLSLRLDTATSHLIHRVRKSVVHHEGVINEEAAATQMEQDARIIGGANGSGMVRDWKEEEQKLIIEIAKDPKNAELYKTLGSIYSKTGEWHDAVESFKKAIELDPEDESIKIKLERAIKKLEKLPA